VKLTRILTRECVDGVFWEGKCYRRCMRAGELWTTDRPPSSYLHHSDQCNGSHWPQSRHAIAELALRSAEGRVSFAGMHAIGKLRPVTGGAPTRDYRLTLGWYSGTAASCLALTESVQRSVDSTLCKICRLPARADDPLAAVTQNALAGRNLIPGAILR